MGWEKVLRGLLTLCPQFQTALKGQSDTSGTIFMEQKGFRVKEMPL